MVPLRVGKRDDARLAALRVPGDGNERTYNRRLPILRSENAPTSDPAIYLGSSSRHSFCTTYKIRDEKGWREAC